MSHKYQNPLITDNVQDIAERMAAVLEFMDEVEQDETISERVTMGHHWVTAMLVQACNYIADQTEMRTPIPDAVQPS